MHAFRDPAVKDGPWGAVDAGLVAAAQQDAERAVLDGADAGAAGATAAAGAGAAARGYALLGKAPEALAQLAQQLGQPGYRGTQLAQGLLRGARSIGDVRGLPGAFREQLEALGVRTGRCARWPGGALLQWSHWTAGRLLRKAMCLLCMLQAEQLRQQLDCVLHCTVGAAAAPADAAAAARRACTSSLDIASRLCPRLHAFTTAQVCHSPPRGCARRHHQDAAAAGGGARD